jgi:DNA helicase-2/ATP-dependent DNA helicase PcrA
VYIAGMEENIFPSNGYNLSLTELEEERRLFYVAMTRAKVKVNVSFSKSRYRWGKTEFNAISRFVREIDNNFLETGLDYEHSDVKSNNNDRCFENSALQSPNTVTTFIKRPPVKKHTPSENFAASDNRNIRIGMRIEHNIFGYGKVIDIDKYDHDGRMTVMFDDNTKKTLLFKFAKVRIVQ